MMFIMSLKNNNKKIKSEDKTQRLMCALCIVFGESDKCGPTGAARYASTHLLKNIKKTCEVWRYLIKS